MQVEVKEEEYWACERCKIDTLTPDSLCPCPRGSCEAECFGTVKTTIEIIIKIQDKKS